MTSAAGVSDPPNPKGTKPVNYLNTPKSAEDFEKSKNPEAVQTDQVQPTDDANAKYDPALKVYWKDFLIS